MPTLQITPDALDLLQNVADTLAKSRKMVIITGAGISTNSGIPDFRSENGLYSLIQDQFERAEANASGKKDTFEDQDQPPSAVASSTVTAFDSSERPTKRRRTSRPCDIASSASSLGRLSPSLATPAPGARTSNIQEPTIADIDTDTDPTPSIRRQDSTQGHVVALTPLDSSRRVTRSRATIGRPILPRHLTQDSVDSSTSPDSVFSGHSPSCASSQTDASSTVTPIPRSIGRHTRTNTPRLPIPHLTSSSPLSSPPPDLFDPYENANPSTDTSSHEDSDCSDTSESDDTQQSSDFFSSQASASNLRNMKGRDLFDSNIWSDPLKTSVFYRFATSLRQRVKEVEPTVTHRFIAQMRDAGKLARVYTQNIDEIEKKIGLSTDLKHGFGNKKRKPVRQQPSESSEKEDVTESADDPAASGSTAVTQAAQKSAPIGLAQSKSPTTSPDKGVECVFLHGSLHSLRCFVCGKLCDWDEDGRESRTLSGEQPECPHCAGATAARQEKGKRALGIGKLRPDIVLYGEEHPQSDLISPIVQHDLAAGPDLLLVLGTSLRVHGLKVMVKEFAKAVHKKGGKVVFINFTKPSESAWGDVLDYWIEWDCDAWVEDLKTRKPLLWLSPDERLGLDRQRREAMAEKKKEALKKRESIIERKRESLGDKREPSSEQGKTRPPPKNPVAMRNDYQCGAYIVWDIFQALAKIGGRPFDNLGYTPSLPVHTPTPRSVSPPISKSGSKPQVRVKAAKTNRKPLPVRVSAQNEGPHHQPSSTSPSSIPKELPNTGGPPSTASTDAVLGDSTLKQHPAKSSHGDKPTGSKRKARRSAPANLAANAHGGPRRKSGKENKHNEKHTGKDRYLQAVRELAKSRKTPTPGHLTMSNRIPATPGHPPPALESHQPGPCPTPSPDHFVSRAGVDEGEGKHSVSTYTSYSFQPRLLPPLPDPPQSQYGASTPHPTPIQATEPEFSQGPVLAPLHVNWKKSPPSNIAPMEIAPLVGPASPLTGKRPKLNKSHRTYTWHHSTQPIYNDPLVGISRQAITHKPQLHVEANDENTPSPSDQLRMEAANQLWQLRGKT